MIPLWIGIAVLMAAALAAVIVLASSKENKKLVTEEYVISSPKIPQAFDGFRIVFLTDLHCNKFGEENEELLRMIDQCDPQIVLVGGDMLISKEDKPTDVPLKLMKELAGKYPVYYANGNHEMRLMRHEEIYGSRYREYVHQLKEYGVWHMFNETIILEQDGQYILLAAIDLEPRFYRRF